MVLRREKLGSTEFPELLKSWYEKAFMNEFQRHPL
jgi:hypothetical protein